MKAFTRKLIAFCNLTPYIKELNPKHLQNTQGRIMQTVNGNKEEMIYIESYPEEPEAEPQDPQMDFLKEMDDDKESPLF